MVICFHLQPAVPDGPDGPDSLCALWHVPEQKKNGKEMENMKKDGSDSNSIIQFVLIGYGEGWSGSLESGFLGTVAPK